MPLDIVEFMAEINRLGVAPANKFEVMIITPVKLQASLNSRILMTQPIFSAYCESAQLPGIGFQTADIMRYGYGPNTKIPVRAVVNDWSATFLSDATGHIYTFFQSWMRFINNFSAGFHNASAQLVQPAYEFNYLDDYVSPEIRVKMFNQANEPFYQVTLHRAYPIFMPDQSLNRNTLDELFKFNVIFTFQEWTSANLEQSSPVRPYKPVIDPERD